MAENRASYVPLVEYWRSCVADTALSRGKFNRRDLKQGGARRFELSGGELRGGRVDESRLELLFGAEGEDGKAEVFLWPLWVERKSSHGVGRADSRPDCVLPVVSVATVLEEDGTIWPQRTVIARDVLEPLPEGVFSIGSVSELDSFLGSSSLSSPVLVGEEDHAEVWEAYRSEYSRLMEEVAGGWPASDRDYVQVDRGLVEVAADSAAFVRGTLALYDGILESGPDCPLLERWAVQGKDAPVAVPGTADSAIRRQLLADRLGHSTDQFPVAERQRDVLSCLAEAGEGEVIAVNGPPGTGKTTMVLSVIAGEWVRAARNGGDPPVTVVASTNNQAVTNVIDAFGKDFADGKGPFAGRWIPDIGSYGVYLPSKTRERDPEVQQKYQTRAFFEKLESREYVERARTEYLKRGSRAFSELENPDVDAVVEALRVEIDRRIGRLEAVDAALEQFDGAEAEVARLLGDNPWERFAGLEAELEDVERRRATVSGCWRRGMAIWLVNRCCFRCSGLFRGFGGSVLRRRGYFLPEGAELRIWEGSARVSMSWMLCCAVSQGRRRRGWRLRGRALLPPGRRWKGWNARVGRSARLRGT